MTVGLALALVDKGEGTELDETTTDDVCDTS